MGDLGRTILLVSISLVSVSLAACGRGSASSGTSSSDASEEQIQNVPSYTPDANDLLTRFNNDAIQHGIVIQPDRLSSIQLRFSEGAIQDAGPGTEQAIGVCEWYKNRITLRLPEAWPYEYPSQDRFYRVFAHEAGHCLLNLLHNDNDATIELAGNTVTIPGASRIMASRESELNFQFDPRNWPNLKAVFFNYAKDVVLNRVDGIEDAEGLGLAQEHEHGVTCAFHQ